jgi:hypothetical protein
LLDSLKLVEKINYLNKNGNYQRIEKEFNLKKKKFEGAQKAHESAKKKRDDLTKNVEGREKEIAAKELKAKETEDIKAPTKNDPNAEISFENKTSTEALKGYQAHLSLPETGIFDEATRKGIQDCQIKNNLKSQKGILDKETVKIILNQPSKPC